MGMLLRYHREQRNVEPVEATHAAEPDRAAREDQGVSKPRKRKAPAKAEAAESHED